MTHVETACVLALVAAVVLSRPGRRRHSLSYTLYMRSPVYRLRRWWWFVTSWRRCERCGCRLSLHRRGLRYALGARVVTVHHRWYPRLLWLRDRRRNVALLCWPCHCRKDAWRHAR